MMERTQTAEAFVAARTGVEAAVTRIGLHSAQIVLVAESGEWLRVAADTVEEAKALCRRLEVEAHDGYPDHLRQRMGAFRRSPEDWAEAPYPERTRRTST